MPIIIIELPQVGESIVEGIIGKWIKGPGDWVDKYDPLVEVVTDKVTMEVPSPVAGKLVKIIAVEGSTIPMGGSIAEIEVDVAPQGVNVKVGPSDDGDIQDYYADQRVGTIGYLASDSKPVGPTGGGSQEDYSGYNDLESVSNQPIYTPIVRRLAKENDIDLKMVSGTGLGGRITRTDILAHINMSGTLGTEIVTPNAVRRTVAEHMLKSYTQIPHAWTMQEVDVTQLVKYRDSIREEFRNQQETELTFLPFVIRAVALTLEAHPYLNSVWSDGNIFLKKGINIGIAVATDNGLMVPVIHDTNEMNMPDIAKKLEDLVSRARSNKLGIDDIRGGTFTVNNTGSLGSVISMPIINYPQAAILTTEVIRDMPRVVGGDIVIRSIMNVCISFDHRVIDGAIAGYFLQSLKSRLENLEF